MGQIDKDNVVDWINKRINENLDCDYLGRYGKDRISYFP